MSYLDTPRLHFAGGFAADPSTVNNQREHHDPQFTITNPEWNPKGKHDFSLQGCTVRSTVDASGVVHQTAADDALVGGSVDASPQGKLVDLDPAFQSGSQVWGLGLRVSAASGGGRVRGRMTTATMRDLWVRRGPEGFSKGVSASYQSVLTDLRWEPGSGSPVLEELRRVSPERLSIKFVAYTYDFMGSKTGRIVGTIGPVQPGEPDHFLAARRASAVPGAALGSRPAREAPFGAVPFKLDPARNMVVLDLGNAVPEQSGGGEPRQLGTMQAVILSPREELGAIDYSKAHYELTAGVNELAITRAQAQRLAGAQLGITVSTQGGDPVMSERPSGLYVDATETVWRMDPDTTESVELVATRFGALLDNHTLSLAVLSGTPASALAIPDPPGSRPMPPAGPWWRSPPATPDIPGRSISTASATRSGSSTARPPIRRDCWAGSTSASSTSIPRSPTRPGPMSSPSSPPSTGSTRPCRTNSTSVSRQRYASTWRGSASGSGLRPRTGATCR